MKIILGKYPDLDFKIITNDGTDITKHLHVKKLVAVAEAGMPLQVTLECSAELELNVLPDCVTVNPVKL